MWSPTDTFCTEARGLTAKSYFHWPLVVAAACGRACRRCADAAGGAGGRRCHGGCHGGAKPFGAQVHSDEEGEGEETWHDERKRKEEMKAKKAATNKGSEKAKAQGRRQSTGKQGSHRNSSR